jgi:hypothetical protein
MGWSFGQDMETSDATTSILRTEEMGWERQLKGTL